MTLHRLTAVLAAGALALGLAACGGSDEPEPAPAATTATTGTAGTTATTAAAPAAPADAVLYKDPAGKYQIGASPTWEESSLTSPKVWYLGDTVAGFRDNVNVVTEALPGSVGLNQYVTLSIANAPKLISDFKLVSNEKVTLTSGEQGGRIVYTGKVGTSPTLQFEAIIAVNGPTAAVVTLTTPPDRFTAQSAAAEPYLRTLQVL